VYGCNTASVLLRGKSYSRGIRAHEIAAQAMQRLQWQRFSKWVAKKNTVTPEEEERTLNLIQNCCASFERKEPVKTGFSSSLRRDVYNS